MSEELGENGEIDLRTAQHMVLVYEELAMSE